MGAQGVSVLFPTSVALAMAMHEHCAILVMAGLEPHDDLFDHDQSRDVTHHAAQALFSDGREVAASATMAAFELLEKKRKAKEAMNKLRRVRLIREWDSLFMTEHAPHIKVLSKDAAS